MKKINYSLFKKVMSKYTTGITVVTINFERTYIGKTVNSFASLSLKPSLILFSLDKKSTSINEYIKSSNLGINILSKNQIKVSKNFSNKKAKWNNAKYFLTKNNIPMLNNCLANLNCKIVKRIKQGDHIIFICRVNEILIDNSKKPLIYFDTKYQ